jgi:hypothetical protein
MSILRPRRRTACWVGLSFVTCLLLVGALSPVLVRTGAPAPLAIVPAAAPGASPPLTINGLVVSPNPVTAGSQFVVNVQVSGGVTPYTYGWNSIPGGCPMPGNRSSWQCTLSSPGEYLVAVNVADSGGNHASASQSFNVTSNNGNGGSGGNGNGKSGSSNGNNSNGFNLSSFGPFLFYGLIAGVVAFGLLVALTVGVIAIAVILSRRLPRPPRGQLVCGKCQSAAPAGAKFCPACAAPLAPPKAE